MTDRIPTLLVVTGPPASGKTTIAHRLAEVLGWPLLAKDEIKEILFDRLGVGDRAWSRQLSDATFALQFAFVRCCLDARVSVILEGNFRAEHAAGLRALAASDQPPVQVVCRASVEVLVSRLRARATDPDHHPGHLDAELLTEIPALRAGAEPLELGGSHYVVDTTQPAELVERAIDRVISDLRRTA